LNARKKLNAVYFSVAIAIALFVGILCQSLTVFAICLAGLTVALLHDGSIRTDRRR